MAQIDNYFAVMCPLGHLDRAKAAEFHFPFASCLREDMISAAKSAQIIAERFGPAARVVVFSRTTRLGAAIAGLESFKQVGEAPPKPPRALGALDSSPDDEDD